MKNFVKFIKQVYEERFSAVSNRIATKKIPVALLSIAPIAQAVEIAESFRAQGLNVTYLVVTDTPPHTSNFNFDIVHVNNAAKIYPRPEYVLTYNMLEFKVARKFLGDVKIINQAKIRGLSPDEVFEIFMAHLPELQGVYESLVDEASKKTFRGYWLGCISNQQSEIVYANTPQYICPGFLPKVGDVVIDCGAFDGSTSIRFANMGCKVYAFEMDRRNYNRALKNAEEKNFVVENLGLGSHKHEMNYTFNGYASTLNGNGIEKAQITTLDSYVAEKNLPRVDFIKMDVEGAELDILKGAAMTIARFKPILALSAYHKLDDFWTLTNFVKSIRPDYEFALRHYVSTPEELSDDFTADRVSFFEALGLEMNLPRYTECVLFAR